MKKVPLILLVVLLLLPSVSFGEVEKQAYYSTQKVIINDKEVPLKGYNIEGNNYYRLRDVAKYFKNTMCAFEVGYEEETNTILLQVPFNRTPQIKDMPNLKKENKKAYPSKSKLKIEIQKTQTLDLEKEKPKAYVVDNYTCFKLRDLAEILLFNMEYNEKTNEVKIQTERVF